MITAFKGKLVLNFQNATKYWSWSAPIIQFRRIFPPLYQCTGGCRAHRFCYCTADVLAYKWLHNFGNSFFVSLCLNFALAASLVSLMTARLKSCSAVTWLITPRMPDDYAQVKTRPRRSTLTTVESCQTRQVSRSSRFDVWKGIFDQMQAVNKGALDAARHAACRCRIVITQSQHLLLTIIFNHVITSTNYLISSIAF